MPGRILDRMDVLSKKRNQPAPPQVLFEALTQPNRDPSRPWLILLKGELMPVVVESREPGLVVWSTLWPERPEAVIRFELPRDEGGYGTELTWTLQPEEPVPEGHRLVEMRRTINRLVNGNLRDTFDQ
jgi:hypothetical protein